MVAAALLAGATGLGLVALGWWVQDWQYLSDWTDPDRWWGGLVRGIGYLIMGKIGFKAALALIAAVTVLIGWLRARASRGAGRAPATVPPEAEDRSTPAAG